MSHIISIWSPSGGAGKTTLSILLAECLEKRGFKTCVYDLTSSKNAEFLSLKNKLKTKVVSSSKDLDNNTEITIVDHQGYTENDANIESADPELLIIPVKPNLLNLTNLSNFINNKETESDILPVFNMCDFSRKEHLKILNSYPHFYKIKNRGIYERMQNIQSSIFNPESDSWASINQARNDIEEFTDLVLYRIKNILPDDKEKSEKVLKLSGK